MPFHEDDTLARIREAAVHNAATFGTVPQIQSGRDALVLLLLLDEAREEVERLRAMVVEQAAESVRCEVIVRRLAACWDWRGDAETLELLANEARELLRAKG